MAAALAGARVVFGGKVGADGRWIVERMRAAGVSVDGSLCVDERGVYYRVP